MQQLGMFAGRLPSSILKSLSVEKLLASRAWGTRSCAKPQKKRCNDRPHHTSFSQSQSHIERASGSLSLYGLVIVNNVGTGTP